jgi:hypothetical protein
MEGNASLSTSNRTILFSKVNPAETTETIRQKREQDLLVRARLRDVMYNSLAQAVFNTYNTPHMCVRILLFLFTLFAVSISSFLVVKSFITYYSYEVSTKTRTMHEAPTPFPKVSLNFK